MPWLLSLVLPLMIVVEKGGRVTGLVVLMNPFLLGIGRDNLASIYPTYSIVSPSPLNISQLIYGINFDAISHAIVLTNMGNLAPSV